MLSVLDISEKFEQVFYEVGLFIHISTFNTANCQMILSGKIFSNILQVQEFEAINGVNSMPYATATDAVEKQKTEKDGAAASPAPKDVKAETKDSAEKDKEVKSESGDVKKESEETKKEDSKTENAEGKTEEITEQEKESQADEAEEEKKDEKDAKEEEVKTEEKGDEDKDKEEVKEAEKEKPEVGDGEKKVEKMETDQDKVVVKTTYLLIIDVDERI